MLDLLSLTPDAARHTLVEWLAQRGEPQYRASQIVPRLWHRPVGSWDQATDLPAELRGALAAAFPLRRLALSARQRSADGTEKYLWDLGDGDAVESVLIPEGKRRTLCISSQVGCALGCVFCATGRMGFRRNLSAAEIAAQVREVILLDPCWPPPTSCSWGWESRCSTGTPSTARSPFSIIRGVWASARDTLRSRRSASCRGSRSSRGVRSNSGLPCRCTPPPRSCATS